MKDYSIDRLRNIAFVSHSGAGKTSLAEAMLYVSKGINRLGRVDDGTSTLDYDQEEIKRQISIDLALAPVEWNEHKINILDAPGYFDFVGDMIAALRVADGAVIVVCASSGVEVGTEKAWAYAEQYNTPRVVFVNKMERENANFSRVVEQLQSMFGPKVVPVQLPIGNAQDYQGHVDLIQQKAYLWDNNEVKVADVPAEMASEVAAAREDLIEAVSVTDDELMMKYLEGEALTDAEIESALAVGTKTGDVVPVFCGSATANVGITELMNYCIQCLPSPAEKVNAGIDTKTSEEVEIKPDDASLNALVFKTLADPYVGKLTLFKVLSGTIKSDSVVHNVSRGRDERIGQLFVIKGKEHIPVSHLGPGDIGAVAKLQETNTNDVLSVKGSTIVAKGIDFPKPVMTMAAQPLAKGDEDKISNGLARLAEEDPTFTVEKSVETSEILISGLGDLHLEVMCSRLHRKFGAEVKLSTPSVPYRETIKGKMKVEGKHKKQSGGRGQYGHVWLEIEPSSGEGGDELEFVDNIFGGAVPKQYIPAVEKGIRETMEEGILAGYPIVNLKVSLFDGSYHSVDSSEMAFKIAASMALKKGFVDANPVLLEPIQNVCITVPESFMGDVMGDLNKKRGKILGMEPKDGNQLIRAQVPLSEMFNYAIDLRSITQGRGSFTMEFSHYEELPQQLAEQVIAARKQEEA
ncbi:MAG: elongation factor G [Firmicutes bacterium]|nr:elongation factor G [Bacillota bacterium]NLL87464.1 elongation factor G [Bacillota bacterium]